MQCKQHKTGQAVLDLSIYTREQATPKLSGFNPEQSIISQYWFGFRLGEVARFLCFLRLYLGSFVILTSSSSSTGDATCKAFLPIRTTFHIIQYLAWISLSRGGWTIVWIFFPPNICFVPLVFLKLKNHLSQDIWFSCPSPYLSAHQNHPHVTVPISVATFSMELE